MGSLGVYMEQIDKHILEGREVIYSVLSRIFLDVPNKNMYEMITKIFPLMKDFVSNEYAQNIMNQLNDYISNSLTDEFLLNWQRDYTRLFCLTDSIPLSESYYTSIDKLVMQESRDQVLALYRKHKFNMNHTSNEPEDHISYELMFVSFLSKQAKLSADENVLKELMKTQMQFINEHLLILSTALTDKMKIYEQGKRFYYPLMLFMIEFIKADYDYISELLNS